MSEKHLSRLSNDNLRYELKMPYRDDTTHIISEPLDFIARLAVLVAKPSGQPDSISGFSRPTAHRAWVTLAKRGKGKQATTGCFGASA